jgi:uncharacterized protein
MEGRVQLPCRLCLEEVDVEVDEDIHFLLAGIGAEEADDPEVFLYDPNAISIDLRPAVRETWLLSVPQFVQCSEDCKGLCPNCGTNLNESTCSCTTTETDPRWDALRKHQSKTH